MKKKYLESILNKDENAGYNKPLPSSLIKELEYDIAVIDNILSKYECAHRIKFPNYLNPEVYDFDEKENLDDSEILLRDYYNKIKEILTNGIKRGFFTRYEIHFLECINAPFLYNRAAKINEHYCEFNEDEKKN